MEKSTTNHESLHSIDSSYTVICLDTESIDPSVSMSIIHYRTINLIGPCCYLYTYKVVYIDKKHPSTTWNRIFNFLDNKEIDLYLCVQDMNARADLIFHGNGYNRYVWQLVLCLTTIQFVYLSVTAYYSAHLLPLLVYYCIPAPCL